MKWFLTTGVLLLGHQSFSQQIVWEKVVGAAVACHQVKDAVTDSRGNIYLVGRYNPIDAAYVDQDILPAKTDTSVFSFGTHAFVKKFRPDGTLLKSTFLPGVEADHIIKLTDNRFAVCGYMNSSGVKNYENDLGRGVFSVFIDSLLNASGYTTYPSYYNSTPIGMISGPDAGLNIAATSLPEYGLTGNARLLQTNSNGNLIHDTTYSYYLRWFDKNNYRATSFEPNAIAAGTGTTFWMTGQVKGMDVHYHDSRPMGLMQLDFGFRRFTSAVFGNRDELPEEEGSFISDLSASDKYVFTVGQDMKSKPAGFAVLFDTKGTILYKKPFDGFFLDSPVTTQIDDTHWAVLSDNESDEFIVTVFDTKGLVKEIKFATRKEAQPQALVVYNHTIYALGNIIEGAVWKGWMARIEF